jgi:hypothetical protein
LAAIFLSMSFVEQVQHADGPVCLDQYEPSPLNFIDDLLRLIGELLFVGSKDCFIALCRDQLIYVDVTAGHRSPLDVAELRLFVGQFGASLDENLLRPISIGERRPLLIAMGDPQSS